MVIVPIILAAIYFGGVGFCYYASNEQANKKLCWNPKYWVSYVRAHIRMLVMPPHEFEQLVFRVYDEKCKGCVEAGYCTARNEDGGLMCGCKMPARAYDPEAECAAGRWGRMLSKSEYKEMKENFKIEITTNFTEK